MTLRRLRFTRRNECKATHQRVYIAMGVCRFIRA
nr:MAG TPA_asm: hypothetical protein [Caudoviricetes sp.]